MEDGCSYHSAITGGMFYAQVGSLDVSSYSKKSLATVAMLLIRNYYYIIITCVATVNRQP